MSVKLSATLWLGCAAAGGWLGSIPDPARLIFLSVGQGDCTVFSVHGTTVLIDAGPSYDGYDSGERVILPKLRRYGIDHVDLIVVTHPDRDHIGGLTSIVRRFPEARVLLSGEFREHGAIQEELKKGFVRKERVLWLDGTVRAKLGSHTLQLAAPSLADGAEENEGSLFVKISDGTRDAVLSGDASAATESSMAQLGDWTAGIMKVGHHGSRSSAGHPWLHEVRPRQAVISCGRANSFGHPHPELLERLRSRGVEILRTDQKGDLVFAARPGGFALVEER